MSTTETQGKKFHEVIKWLMVLILLVVAVVGNYLYRDVNSSLRTLAIVLIITLSGGVALITDKGKFIVMFAREACIEVRKVIWPTPQETFHITLIVAAVTIVLSLILWGLDSVLMHMISMISSLRF